MEYLNFDKPTQLKFWDGLKYVGGIGIDDKIICGCCGSIIEPKEVYEYAPASVEEPIVVYDNDEDWIDISNKIIHG